MLLRCPRSADRWLTLRISIRALFPPAEALVNVSSNGAIDAVAKRVLDKYNVINDNLHIMTMDMEEGRLNDATEQMQG
ncbi:hypothetical protein N9L68_08510, partial [bacterium]|nr:hypothetical protein [bacterium]